MPWPRANPVARRAPNAGAPARISTYWDATREPLYCLVFLFPLVAVYEFGALLLRPAIQPDQQLVAQRLIEGLVAWFGPGGFWVPGFALLITLLIWHLLAKRPWQIRVEAPFFMLVESVVLTMPLFVLNSLMLSSIDSSAGMLQAGGVAGADVKRQIVLALGAGIYEELVFRLYLISILMFVLVDVSRVPARAAMAVAVVIAALVFALCHVKPIGAEEFELRRFALRALAGGYLSLLFVTRGLGISTGTHAAYNLMLVAMRGA